jgi:hypothetical protein
VQCANGTPQLFAGLTSEPFDAAEFRVQAASLESPQIWFGQGALCSTAADSAACASKVAVAEDESNLPFDQFMPMFGMCARYVLTTRGDDVRTYASREGLLQFLGPIDSPEDALLLLFYDQHQVLCPGTSTTDFRGIDPKSFEAQDDGYRVSLRSHTSNCSQVTEELVTLHVARDGTVTELARETTVTGPALCAGRRPEGLSSRHVAGSASALGEHFARMAHLEQASITLAEEVEVRGATRLGGAARAELGAGAPAGGCRTPADPHGRGARQVGGAAANACCTC